MSVRRKLTTLREAWALDWAHSKAITDQAQAEGRDLTKAEHDEVNVLLDGVRSKATEIKRLEAEGGLGQQRANPSAPAEGEVVLYRDGHRVTSGASGSAANRRTLSKEQRFADWARARPGRGSELFGGSGEAKAEDVSLGRLVRGMVTGDWNGADLERRTLLEGTDSAGGFLTPEVLGSVLIDRVRNQGRVFQAGATTVPLESDTHSIPRLSTGITPAWKSEGAAVSESDPAFERVTFTARTLPVITRLSYELAEDSDPQAVQVIEDEVVKALALELDRVALRGTGTPPEPKGVVNQTNVELQSLGANGATPTLANLITSVYGVRKDNMEPTGILWSARTGETYAKLVDTTGQPINYPSSIADIPRFETNQIPDNLTVGSSTDCSEVYVGKWDELLVGIRSNIKLQVLRERYADEMEIGLLAYVRADIQLAHPKGFTVVTGVRP